MTHLRLLRGAGLKCMQAGSGEQVGEAVAPQRLRGVRPTAAQTIDTATCGPELGRRGSRVAMRHIPLTYRAREGKLAKGASMHASGRSNLIPTQMAKSVIRMSGEPANSTHAGSTRHRTCTHAPGVWSQRHEAQEAAGQRHPHRGVAAVAACGARRRHHLRAGTRNATGFDTVCSCMHMLPRPAPPRPATSRHVTLPIIHARYDGVMHALATTRLQSSSPAPAAGTPPPSTRPAARGRARRPPAAPPPPAPCTCLAPGAETPAQPM